MKNENNNNMVDSGYWKWKLKNYLTRANKAFYLNMVAQDTLDQFLTLRSSLAETEYTLSLSSGASDEGAKELAFAALFEGIEFSRVEHLEYLMMTHYPKEYHLIDDKKSDAMFHELALMTDSVYNKIMDNFTGEMDAIDKLILPHIAQFLLKFKKTYQR
ncbi:DUF1896 family protein [Pedobacter jeongneungensis]|uniref:DUF1896 family protein n=1 Tax=Pedobacter jeongneungensis TaxID=947309 RepID=UPI000469B9FA|nr:DUF1896 family protein [Pedobacter jeongneungensis]